MNFDYNKKNYIAKNTDVLHGEFFKALNNFLAFFSSSAEASLNMSACKMQWTRLNTHIVPALHFGGLRLAGHIEGSQDSFAKIHSGLPCLPHQQTEHNKKIR